MRTLTLVALLAATTFADEAADLFYCAFWLEQSGRGNADAEKLYRELITKHADAPEAPRAYLALIRMRSATGVKVDDMLKALERGYPGAKKEIELARRLAAEGYRTLLVCFNQRLATTMQRDLAEAKAPAGLDVVFRFCNRFVAVPDVFNLNERISQP